MCNSRAFCKDENCTVRHGRSFASHEKSEFWDFEKNDPITPRNVFKSTNKKFWFKCEKCPHSFESQLDNIIKGQWCPYCAGQKLCDDYCEICEPKSFASHEKSKFWDLEKNGSVTPRDVFKNAHKKFWFKCDKCFHSFKSQLDNVIQGQWCPYCINKTETKLLSFLTEHHTVQHKFKPSFAVKRGKNYYEYDFLLGNNIVLELDGPQHFIQVSNWKTPDHNLQNDFVKQFLANMNDYHVIRIVQSDVWDDTYDWKNLLQVAIEHLQSSNEIQNLYLDTKGEYNNLKKLTNENNGDNYNRERILALLFQNSQV